jgi:WD40 repeat protein
MNGGCIALVLVSALISSFASASHHGCCPHPKILWNVKPYPTPTNLFGVAVPTVEFSPDGEQIITAGLDGTVKFLNRSNGAVANTILAHTGAVHTLSLSKDGQVLASGGQDRMLNLWRVSDGTLLRSINAHTSAVHSVAFSPDASLVISSGGPDNQLKIWRTTDGELVRSIRGNWGPTSNNPRGGMWSVAFAPDGQRVAGSALEVWTLDGTRVGNFFWTEALTHVRFTPDSSRVFGTIPYGTYGFVIADGTRFMPRGTSAYPPNAISPDGRSLITTSRSELIWSVMPPRSWLSLDDEIRYYGQADGEGALGFSALAFDPRMRTLAAGTFTGEVLLFELPIWISGIQTNGDQVNLQWQGGSGNYQLQKLTGSNTWEDLGGPLTGNAASVSIDSSSAILRVRNTAP